MHCQICGQNFWDGIVVTETDMSSDQCVSDAYKRLSSGIIMIIGPKDCVFGDDKYSRDITRKTLQEVKTRSITRRWECIKQFQPKST